MHHDPEAVASLPWVQAILPKGKPYWEKLSSYSDLHAWHVDVEFREWPIPPELVARWAEKRANTNDTWRKRPLAVGEYSGCPYSCGELELTARLKKAGYQSFWVSEWKTFEHVACWRPLCVKRNELEERAPELWAHDHNLRMRAEARSVYLGKGGGHPDVGAWKTGVRDFVFVEYKGPGDTVNEKQDLWAQSLMATTTDRLAYVVARGHFT